MDVGLSFPGTYATATRVDDAGTSVALASGTNRHMLKISCTATTEKQRVLLRLEGQVRGPWVEELRRACDQMLGENGHYGNRLVLDLAEVSFIDADGVTLFRELTAVGSW